jgi:hypothetical protein
MSEKSPILILEGSKQPYLSIGRHYGGIRAFGYDYVYFTSHDAFIKKDYVRKYNKHKKSGGKWEGFIEFIKSKKI